MTTKPTRRQLGLLAIGSAGVLKVAAQTPVDWFAQAVQSKKDAAAELARFDLEMSVEPAFQFKA